MGIEQRASTGSADFEDAQQASEAADEIRVAQGPARRAYVPPQLRHLGSVRHLTLGPTGNVGDGTSTFQKGTMMSSREAKEDIAYLDGAARKRLADEVMALRLANYRYKADVSAPLPLDHTCLGFIVEDTSPEAPFVVQRKEVDVYGFASAILAALQEQQATIARLEKEITELRGGTSGVGQHD